VGPGGKNHLITAHNPLTAKLDKRPAAYAINEDAAATLLESRGLLWNLRGCRTRWLHPNLFRYWPYPEWKCAGTNFPVMNWYAGYANDVGDYLHRKFPDNRLMSRSTSQDGPRPPDKRNWHATTLARRISEHAPPPSPERA
jgi:hypothetical protein